MSVTVERMKQCDCGQLSREVVMHADDCALFACDACGAKVFVEGIEHAPDCAERCPHCGSEGRDNDHREGCPTIGTCAQTNPSIPRDQWHYEPPFGQEAQDLSGSPIGHAPSFSGHWRDWLHEHMATQHPSTRSGILFYETPEATP